MTVAVATTPKRTPRRSLTVAVGSRLGATPWLIALSVSGLLGYNLTIARGLGAKPGPFFGRCRRAGNLEA
jgi:hypothetical protein